MLSLQSNRIVNFVSSITEETLIVGRRIGRRLVVNTTTTRWTPLLLSKSLTVSLVT